MPEKPEPPVLPFPSRDQFAGWMEKNHASQEPGIWLKFAKKGTGVATVTYAEALDVALCYGWIDGQSRSFDETWYLQKFTPRRARSKWSKINRDNVERLIASGEMKPAGLAEIERAKADGRWDAAYDSPANAKVPDDLRAALAKKPKAAKLFEELDSRNRFAILSQLQDAKKPETRQRRIDKYVAMLAKGETPYPLKRKG